MLQTADVVTQVVFGHPNHELAIFGLLQRLRPRLLYLTDGGGAERVAQTREGLASIGLLDHAHFLDWPEDSFYQALLRRDGSFFGAIAAKVAEEIRAHRPSQVLCDGLEFYNPVHDLSVPIVRRALDRLRGSEVRFFEVPLVFQKLGDEETYEIQRMRPARRQTEEAFFLTPEEIAAKTRARQEVYTLLLEQVAPILAGVLDGHFDREVVGRHEALELVPPEDVVLRYEWRGELLRQRGEVEEVITFDDHYLPTVRALLDS